MTDLTNDFIAFLRSEPDHPVDFWAGSDICALARFGQSRHPDEDVSGGGWSYFLNGKQIDVLTENMQEWYRAATYAEAADILER